MTRLSQTGFRVWTRQDIEGILLAMAADEQYMREYVNDPVSQAVLYGHGMALQAVAAAFGIELLKEK